MIPGIKVAVDYVRKHTPVLREFLTADFGELTPQQQRAKAAEARKKFAVAAAGVAPLPVPLADIWLITPIQILMIQAIANIYGYKLDWDRLVAVFPVVAGGWIGRQAALALFKIGLPGLGGLTAAAFAYVWTLGMGKAAERYFASGMKLGKRQLAKEQRAGIAAASREVLPEVSK